jgi:hypothetical protein
VDAVSALLLTLSLTILLTLLTCRIGAQASAPVQAPNVALAHGAWAGGASRSEVIPRLQAAGLHVTAVQNRTDTRRGAFFTTKCLYHVDITVVDTLVTNTAKEKT